MKTFTKSDIRGDGDEILTPSGLVKFTYEIEQDEDIGPPWKESDFHGPVSQWTTRDKHAGEWILHKDRHSRLRLYYDAAEAQRMALRDGWGLSEEDTAALAKKLDHAPSRGEVAVEAVRHDFKRLQDWCEDRWCWLWYRVTVTGPDGQEYEDTLGGIDDEDYARECIAEFINSTLTEIQGEAEERAHWEARDSVTI